MKNSWYKKGIVYAVIVLFISMSVLSSVSSKDIATSIMENHPPDFPWINGEASPKIGETYEYSFWTTDPDGDNVSYFIDWDDGTTTGWIGQCPSGEGVKFSHAWYEPGNYLLQCKAKDHPYEAESDWSSCIIKVPPKNRAYSNTLLLRFLEQFPLLERFLTLLMK